MTVYTPHQRQRIGFFKSWLVMVANIVQSRELVVQLFKRDFLAVYKKSFLGVAWVILLPVLGVVPVVFMQAANVLQPGVAGVPYPAFALLSISVWQLFAGSLTLSSQALRSASTFILQVNFPHEALLVKQCAQQLANSLLAFALALVVLVVSGVTPHWQVVLLPLMSVPLFLLGAGLGLLLAVGSIFTADLERALVYVVQLLLYLSPVVYAADVSHPVLQTVIDLNPLTYLVGDVRDVILYGTIAHFDRYLYACAFAVVVFLGAWRLFFLSEQQVIEKLV